MHGIVLNNKIASEPFRLKVFPRRRADGRSRKQERLPRSERRKRSFTIFEPSLLYAESRLLLRGVRSVNFLDRG